MAITKSEAQGRAQKLNNLINGRTTKATSNNVKKIINDIKNNAYFKEATKQSLIKGVNEVKDFIKENNIERIYFQNDKDRKNLIAKVYVKGQPRKLFRYNKWGDHLSLNTR